MFFEGITATKVCIKIELSRREWMYVLLLVIFDEVVLAPHSLKKFFMKRFSMKKKSFRKKSRNLPWVELIWNSECLGIQQKSRKIDFGFVQIGKRFNFSMKIFFLARNNYRDKLDSYLCLKSSQLLKIKFCSKP